MKKHCCTEMSEHIQFECAIHRDPFECPDQIILFDEEDNEYAFIIHDGGTSTIGIDFCPWCGSKLG